MPRACFEAGGAPLQLAMRTLPGLPPPLQRRARARRRARASWSWGTRRTRSPAGWRARACSWQPAAAAARRRASPTRRSSAARWLPRCCTSPAPCPCLWPRCACTWTRWTRWDLGAGWWGREPGPGRVCGWWALWRPEKAQAGCLLTEACPLPSCAEGASTEQPGSAAALRRSSACSCLACRQPAQRWRQRHPPRLQPLQLRALRRPRRRRLRRRAGRRRSAGPARPAARSPPPPLRAPAAAA